MRNSTRRCKRPYTPVDSQPNQKQRPQNLSKLLKLKNKPQCPEPHTCMAIFPEELWEMILDTMEDSINIQSVLGALPELDCLFQRRKADWYFDRIFPHIFKQFYGFYQPIEMGTLLALRGVSTRWCSVVGEFLKNHPSRHPYNHNGINRRNVPHGQFNYMHEDAQLLILEGTEMIQICYNEMMDHPRNPFIVGRLIITNLCLKTPHGPFLDASLRFLKKYGHYISTFEFTIELSPDEEFEADDAANLFRKIFDCISCTGNVKYLNMNLMFEQDIIYNTAESIFTPEYPPNIPQLPQLETLILENLGYNGNGCLSNAFSLSSCINNLKRLEAPLDTNMFSNKRSFPNLSELCLEITAESHLDFDRLTFLNKENCPILKKLSFITTAGIAVSITELFSVLARLEIEEMLLLGNCKITNDKTCNLSPISSMKYFRVGDGFDHSFEFMKMFPSLEQLHLHIRDAPEVTAEKIEEIRLHCRKDRGFSSQLRMYLYEHEVPKDVNVWEVLPAIKLLTLEKYGTFQQFARECGNKSFWIQWQAKDNYESDGDDGESSNDDIDLFE